MNSLSHYGAARRLSETTGMFGWMHSSGIGPRGISSIGKGHGVPEPKPFYLVQDNSSIHTSSVVKAWFCQHPEIKLCHSLRFLRNKFDLSSLLIPSNLLYLYKFKLFFKTAPGSLPGFKSSKEEVYFYHFRSDLVMTLISIHLSLTVYLYLSIHISLSVCLSTYLSLSLVPSLNWICQTN